MRCKFICSRQSAARGNLLSGSFLVHRVNLNALRSSLFQLVYLQIVAQGFAELVLCVSPVLKSLTLLHMFLLAFILHVMRGGSYSSAGFVAANKMSMQQAAKKQR